MTVPLALERMGGLQAQYAPAMYVGPWSRVADLTREFHPLSAVDGRAVAQEADRLAAFHR